MRNETMSDAITWRKAHSHAVEVNFENDVHKTQGSGFDFCFSVADV